MRKRVLITAALVGASSALTAPAATAQESEPAADASAQQWGLAQVNASDAWSSSTGAGQTIAVVDSGVDLGHPDLAGKLVPGATFVGCGDKPAPCGNGDWRGTDGQGQPADVHGTHVSGIAAGSGDITGVAPDANIMPIKALEDGSGGFDEIGQGVRYAADNGADVINLSVGAFPGSQALTLLGLTSETKDAIAYARDKGVVVVAAAGNDSAPLCATPAFESGALCVGATDQQEDRAVYSNLGLKLDTDVISGPGGSSVGGCEEDVWSTVPRGTGSGECGDADHDAMAGTSMAAPHVAGVAALLTGQGRDAENVEQALLDSARTPVLDNARGTYTPLYGKGIVDAGAAVRAPA